MYLIFVYHNCIVHPKIIVSQIAIDICKENSTMIGQEVAMFGHA